MKKIIALLMILLGFSLSGCTSHEVVLDYSTFEDHLIYSYDAAVFQHENKYIVYYYSENCSHCAEVKDDILSFFNTFDSLPFYILEVSQASDTSSLEEFVGTPTIFIMSDSTVYESYIGSNGIIDFIDDYLNLEIDYRSFENLTLTTYQAALEIENEPYLLYYYTEANSDCIALKEPLLTWAYTKRIGDIYFLDSTKMTDELPSELMVLSTELPLLIVMSNGEYTGESYIGNAAILGYVEAIGTGNIENLK